ncbi:hypothetical protein KDM41_04795 [bacterium]|nr:hypothetical protein [bacterium]
MAGTTAPAARSCPARFITNVEMSSGLIRLDCELDAPLPFRPGQFAMLNLADGLPLVFSRPFSILAGDGTTLSFLYRVVGRGTAALARLKPGQGLTVLGPLGRPFPTPDELEGRPAVLIGGGVGLPPVHAWFARHGRDGDTAFFGGRDGADVPWSMLDARWGVSVDRAVDVPADREAFAGVVTELVASRGDLADGRTRAVLACGPIPLLRAAARLAAARGWDCWVSLEEHMGCGYGVCKGCVVPVATAGPDGWRNATCCDEGPVFRADQIRWDRYGVPVLPTT